MANDKQAKKEAAKAEKEAKKQAAKEAKEAKKKEKADAKDAKKQAKEDKKKDKKKKKEDKKKGKQKSDDEEEDALLDDAGGEEKAAESGEDGEGDADAEDADEDDDDAPLDALEATEEELEEERMDVAVRLIQDLYRKRRGRKLLREMVRANFIKEYDQETGEFFYKNIRTGKTQHTKPAALGSEDLPDPPVYFAPKGYIAEESATRQFACVITCSQYSEAKLENLAEHVNQDHEDLRGAIIHPYLAKFKDEDCIFMKNPTKSGVTTNFDVRSTFRPLCPRHTARARAPAAPTPCGDSPRARSTVSARCPLSSRWCARAVCDDLRR